MQSNAEKNTAEFVPALRFKWATGLYDGVIEYSTRGHRLRTLSVQAIAPKAGEAILDLGCGTGGLTIALAEDEPHAAIAGYDIDPDILEIALEKAAKLKGENRIAFEKVNVSDPTSIPLSDIGRFNCVTSSLVFHHLTRDQKKNAMKSALALLRPGGRFVLIDWGPGANFFLKYAFWLVRLLDGLAVTSDNAKGKMPELLAEAGFSNVKATPMLNTIFGTVWCYKATA